MFKVGHLSHFFLDPVQIVVICADDTLGIAKGDGLETIA